MTAPLAGALLYILNTGDAVAGALVLFAMGRETGAPLLLISTQPEADQELMHQLEVSATPAMLNRDSDGNLRAVLCGPPGTSSTRFHTRFNSDGKG